MKKTNLVNTLEEHLNNKATDEYTIFIQEARNKVKTDAILSKLRFMVTNNSGNKYSWELDRILVNLDSLEETYNIAEIVYKDCKQAVTREFIELVEKTGK